MKRSPGVLLAVILMAARTSGAVFNDGTTTNNLTPLPNAITTFDGYPTLDSDTNGFLVAGQAGSITAPLLRTAWYANTVAATSVVYTASADFKPAVDSLECRGGVAAWLDTAGSNYITCQVVPGDSFRVSVVNFLTGDAADNESSAHLFNTDGTPATGTTNSAWADLGTNYVAADFATFELQFLVPTPAELAALSNATAHVAARIWQPTGTNRVQVSRTIDLLTDLPVPAPAAHRFGYFGLWASIFDSGTIGYFRNLGAAGALRVNQPPSVRITSPAPDATFVIPATIPLTADAGDPDGTVARVDFYADATWIGAATNAQFSILWVDAALGDHTLLAVATDNEGATAATAPVPIRVISLPTVTLTSPASGAEFFAPANILLAADASDTNSAIDHVDFYAGTKLLESVTNAPYALPWPAVPAGAYDLTAVAVNTLGGRATSAVASITVKISLPTVTLTSPTNGAVFLAPASIPLAADASDTNSAITKVDFYAGTNLLGTVTNTPYALTWSAVPAGGYDLTAVAVNTLGGQATSAVVRVTVNPPGVAPTLTVKIDQDQLLLTWTSTGYQLQVSTNVAFPSAWRPVPVDTTGVTQYRVPLATAGSLFYRLVSASGPGQPSLKIQLVTNQVVVSWPPAATGFQLEGKANLNATTWTLIPTTGNSHTENAATGSRIFRLRQ